MTWMGSKTDIAAIMALDATDYQDGILFFALVEKVWLVLEKTNTTAVVNGKSCFTATGGGRWFLSRDSTVIATTMPTGAAATGTRWIYQENSAVNSFDSVITYVYNGTAWVETDARIRTYAGSPDFVESYDPVEDVWNNYVTTPNSAREQWIDTSNGTIYTAFNGGWVAGAGAS